MEVEKKMMKIEAEEAEEEAEEKAGEDWCFICKDGGTLIICDHRDCAKVYHRSCVETDDSGALARESFICKRHTCYLCGVVSRLWCVCCPNAVCRECVTHAEFTRIKGSKGLCNICMELVQILEELRKYASKDQIDLTDRDTEECLFLEYWEIIKEKEGMSLKDIENLFVSASRKKGAAKSRYKEDYEPDSDIEEPVEKKVKSRKKEREFTGWGSKPLIEFLQYLGKDTSEELSQYAVDSVICEYIRAKNLYHFGNKRRVVCDEKLHAIFKKKYVHKNKIYGLLERHYKQNVMSLEDDILDLQEENRARANAENGIESCKRHRLERSQEKPFDEETEPELQLSGNASIVTQNIKLVYLRKSLVEDLSKQHESFEDKVLGSFVKVKTDPRDLAQRNPYEISQVTGISRISAAEGLNSNILLRVSGVPNDVCFSKLSDLDINEDEMTDLKQKVKNGLIKQPTVVELQQKAKILHKDITKHWITRRLSVLQNRIDWANEKGWRKELSEYLEEREMLKQPSEQEKLLQQIPRVIADVIEAEAEAEAEPAPDDVIMLD